MAVNWAVSDLSGFPPRLVEKAPAASRSCRGEGKKKPTNFSGVDVSAP